MKLIIEKTEGKVYTYIETERHHKRVEARRQRKGKIGQRRAAKILGDECCIGHNHELQDDFYMVFNLKGKQ